MKKILSLVLVLMMMALLLSSAALADGGLSITLGSATMDEATRTVTIPINVTANPGVSYLDVTIQYSADVFESINVTNGSLLDGFTSGAVTAGKKCTWDAEEDATGTGTLGTVTMKVKEGVTTGNYTVTAVVNEAYNGNEADVSVSTITPATVSVPGAAHTHTWDAGEVTTSATCTTAGEKTFHCTGTDCEETKTEAIAALGHAWDAGEVTTPATCTTAGVKTFTCTRANCEETKTETIAALGHAWDDGEVTTPATCTVDGVKPFTCTRNDCEETKTEAIKAQHTWDEGQITKEATTEVEGEKLYTCTVCKETKTEKIAKLPTPEVKPAVKPAAKSATPKTGDESHAALWLAVALLGGCAVVGTTVIAKKKNYTR